MNIITYKNNESLYIISLYMKFINRQDVLEINNQKIELYKNDYKLSDANEITFNFNNCTFGYNEYKHIYNPLNIIKKQFIEYDNNINVEEILKEYGFKYSIKNYNN